MKSKLLSRRKCEYLALFRAHKFMGDINPYFMRDFGHFKHSRTNDRLSSVEVILGARDGYVSAPNAAVLPL